ncbi:MAG: MBL fold metallo-hydrolase [Alphaproteobacteria bacterium]|nr:MAG: MBL fold metallo-hydrolase [Alphaproteobacteria bacterium]
MRITRRRFTMAGASALAVAGLPARLWSGTTLELGPARLDTLSDGHLVLPASFALAGLDANEAAAILSRHGLSPQGPFEPPCNVTLLRDGERVVMFDVGSGPNFMPSAGKLDEALDALGVSREDVTHVVFTHAHPDHIWGLLDDFGDPAFENAEFFIGAAEFDYWMDPETVNRIDPARQSFAVGAKNRLEAIADVVHRFADGEEILPGIAAHATHGHTPGHMSFEIAAGGGSVMVVGDAIINHYFAFERPDWPAPSDQDPETGARTRVALLDRLAHEQMTFVGFHLPGGGIGRAERRAEGGYRFVEIG